MAMYVITFSDELLQVSLLIFTLDLTHLKTQIPLKLADLFYLFIYFNAMNFKWICSDICLLFVYFYLQILVYDRFGQDIISPLLNVKELRDLGVTLHL